MTDNQKNTIMMYESLIAFLDSTKESWSSKAPIVQSFSLFRGMADQIFSTSLNQQKSDPKGATEQMNIQKTKLIDLVANISLKLKVYATYSQNSKLLETVKLSSYKLTSYSQLKLANHCQIVYDYAQQLKEEASGYEITKEDITQLLSELSIYKSLHIERDDIGDKRTRATSDLDKKIREATAQLKLLDASVKAYNPYPSFADDYLQARKVTERGRKAKSKAKEDPDQEKQKE